MAPRPPLYRLRTRPEAREWAEDELMTFTEAAALLFPAGPFTAASLRSAHRRGELSSVSVCGRTFTSRRAVSEMATPERRPRETERPATNAEIGGGREGPYAELLRRLSRGAR